MFERAYVINLRRRPDRLARLASEMHRHGWPFPTPRIFHAIDGHAVLVPDDFFPHARTEAERRGGFGCIRSHIAILQECIRDRLESVLILEDDAALREGFADEAKSFLDRVPDDWQGLMFGGSHAAPPQPIAPGIVRVIDAHLSHAYAASADYMHALLERWGAWNGMIDSAMKDWQHNYRVFAPQPWIIGQAGGMSDISGHASGRDFFNRDSGPSGAELNAKPLLLLDVPKTVADDLRRQGIIHTGRDHEHDPATGIDRLLREVIDQPQALRAWIHRTRAEAHLADARPAIFFPGIDPATVREAAQNVQHFTATTATDAIAQMKGTE